MSAADLLKMYNLEPLPSSNDPQIVEVDSASEISEESDQMKEPADNAAGSAEGQGLQFWDSSKLCMVRSKEGKKVYAKMSEGEGGFLLAQFEGDANPVQTEVPNLVLHGAGMVPEKRPGAAKKAAAKKAAAKKAAAKKAAAKKAVTEKPAGLLPSDDLEGPNDADPDAAPNDAAPSAAKSVSADPPAFDPLCPCQPQRSTQSCIIPTTTPLVSRLLWRASRSRS